MGIQRNYDAEQGRLVGNRSNFRGKMSCLLKESLPKKNCLPPRGEIKVELKLWRADVMKV